MWCYIYDSPFLNYLARNLKQLDQAMQILRLYCELSEKNRLMMMNIELKIMLKSSSGITSHKPLLYGVNTKQPINIFIRRLSLI